MKGTVSPPSRDAYGLPALLTSLPAACQNRSVQLQSRVPTTATLVTSLSSSLARTRSHSNRKLEVVPKLLQRTGSM